MKQKALEIDQAIASHKAAVARIMDKMEPLRGKATMMWVPIGYDLRTTADAPKVKRGQGVNAGKYFLNPEAIEYVAVLKKAEGQGKTYFLLSQGRLVNADYCREDGKQYEPLPIMKKQKLVNTQK